MGALYAPDRLEALRRTNLMDTGPELAFDRLTRLVQRVLDVPTSFLSLVDDERQFYKSCVGLGPELTEAREAPLSHSYCKYVVARDRELIVEDAREHPLLAGNPAIEDYDAIAYLGIPVRGPDGHVLGTLCALDRQPHDWSEQQIEIVRDLAAGAETEIELRADIQRREQLERELSEREETFRVLVGNVTDVVTVLDEDGTIRFESPSIEEALGYDHEELVGESVWEYVHEEDRERVRDTIASVLEERGRRQSVELRFRDAKGRWRILESIARSLPTDSSLGAILASSRDVTERRELEESLRLLATAVENAETGVMITGPDLDAPGPEIQYVNEAMTRITGYAEDELVGSTPRLLQGPDTERAVLDELRTKVEAGESFEGQTVNYRKDGTPYHLRWKVTPIAGEDGEVTHYVSVQEDVTEQVKREELLEARVRERTRELDRSQSEALARLARAAEYRDDQTGQHTQRVGKLSAALAGSLGKDEPWIDLIREAAPLHDLGKIGVADSILRKPGPLSDEEYRAMQQHAETGAELLSGGRSEVFRMAERIARHHHEQWDGGGYPDGLQGAQIPLPARIVGVADSFDAMTNDRPYRDALPFERALAELREGAGGQFDPQVVDAILEGSAEISSMIRDMARERAG